MIFHRNRFAYLSASDVSLSVEHQDSEPVLLWTTSKMEQWVPIDLGAARPAAVVVEVGGASALVMLSDPFTSHHESIRRYDPATGVVETIEEPGTSTGFEPTRVVRVGDPRMEPTPVVDIETLAQWHFKARGPDLDPSRPAVKLLDLWHATAAGFVCKLGDNEPTTTFWRGQDRKAYTPHDTLHHVLLREERS